MRFQDRAMRELLKRMSRRAMKSEAECTIIGTCEPSCIYRDWPCAVELCRLDLPRFHIDRGGLYSVYDITLVYKCIHLVWLMRETIIFTEIKECFFPSASVVHTHQFHPYTSAVRWSNLHIPCLKRAYKVLVATATNNFTIPESTYSHKKPNTQLSNLVEAMLPMSRYERVNFANYQIEVGLWCE